MIKIFSKFFCFFFLFLLFFSPTLATTIISPVLELTADPGTIQPGVVKVYNETNNSLFLVSSVDEFTTGNEEGQPVYVPTEDRGDFLDWFSVGEETMVLVPGQAAVVPFTVDIPSNAVPGGYYATIFWENIPPQRGDDDNVAVRGKVGTLIFLRVNGEVVEQGEVITFSTRDNQTTFYELPVIFVTRIQNFGNVHLQPQGTVTLRNMLGKKKVFELGDGKANILPNSVRRFEVVWGQTAIQGNFFQKAWSQFIAEARNITIGRFSATLDVTFGIDNQQTVQKQISFWIIPYHLISGVIIIFILLIIATKINSKVSKLKKKVASIENGTTK